MSDLRQRLVENMKTIKQMMLDVENASHYVDFLDKAIADKLAAGLTMEPKEDALGCEQHHNTGVETANKEIHSGVHAWKWQNKKKRKIDARRP